MMVSVIIPLYNKAPYIQRALDSVLAQTYADFEVIVVDDGSTDGSFEIVRAYSDSRIRMLCQANAGVSSARNQGIAVAKADWLSFLDADDEWLTSFLERTCEFVQQHPTVNAVFTNFTCDSYSEPHNPPYPGGDAIVEDYFRFALCCGGYPVHGSAFFVARSAIVRAGCFPVGVAYGEDIDTFNRIACHSLMGCISDPLVIYHDSVAGAEVKHRAEGYPYPLTVTTLRGMWPSGIPMQLRRSVYEYINYMLLAFVNNQIAVGRRLASFKVLIGECRPTVNTWRMYLNAWKGLTRSLIPRGARYVLRAIRSAGRKYVGHGQHCRDRHGD